MRAGTLPTHEPQTAETLLPPQQSNNDAIPPSTARYLGQRSLRAAVPAHSHLQSDYNVAFIYDAHRGTVDLHPPGVGPVKIGPHEAQQAREAEAVVPVRVRDENLGDPRGPQAALLDLLSDDTRPKTQTQTRFRGV